MEIVVPTYNVHYAQIKLFLTSFEQNCLDKNNITIKLIVSRFDMSFFYNLCSSYLLHIKIIPFDELLQKYTETKMTEIVFLEKVGKKSYVSYKKIWGISECSK